MNLPGVADPGHADREVVDLLFFPTGGGKTEAYLGLAAFTLVLRRLRNPGVASAGLSVLMRYTLRLLTLDQLGRAATLICALELERRNDVDQAGRVAVRDRPVGRPRRHAERDGDVKGDGNTDSARSPHHRLQERQPQAVAHPAGRMPLVRRRKFTPQLLRPHSRREASHGPAHPLRQPRLRLQPRAHRCRSWPWTSRSTAGCPVS